MGLTPIGAMVGFVFATTSQRSICYHIWPSLLIILHCFFLSCTFKRFSFCLRTSTESHRSWPIQLARATVTLNSLISATPARLLYNQSLNWFVHVAYLIRLCTHYSILILCCPLGLIVLYHIFLICQEGFKVFWYKVWESNPSSTSQMLCAIVTLHPVYCGSGDRTRICNGWVKVICVTYYTTPLYDFQQPLLISSDTILPFW